MEIFFVDAPSFVDTLKNLLSNCTQLDIAMAYVKIGGLKPFLNAINDSPLMRENRKIRIVFGLSSFQGITDRESAELLLKVSRKHKNVTVKKYDNPRFHPKLMIFHGTPTRILVGSSNLTEGAHSNNAEANVIIEGPDTKFMNDVVTFFETHFDRAPHLAQRHVESYTPQPRFTSRNRHDSSSEDELPSRQEQSQPRTERKHGIGRPIKPKSYYDRKIRDLERKKGLTEQEKGSLRAYRALRTRYYRARKRAKRLAILQPVTHGERHLEDLVEEGYGAWTIGCKISKDRYLVGAHIYFYENRVKRVRYRATIQSIQRTKEETRLAIRNVEELGKSRELHSFRKLNGEKVRAMRRFAYINNKDT